MHLFLSGFYQIRHLYYISGMLYTLRYQWLNTAHTCGAFVFRFAKLTS